MREKSRMGYWLGKFVSAVIEDKDISDRKESGSMSSGVQPPEGQTTMGTRDRALSHQSVSSIDASQARDLQSRKESLPYGTTTSTHQKSDHAQSSSKAGDPEGAQGREKVEEEKLWQHCKTMKAKADKYRAMYSELGEQMDKLGQHHQEAKSLNEELTIQVAKLTKALSELEQESKASIRALEGQIREQEKVIRKAQEDVYAAKSKSAWTIEPDSVLNAGLESLDRAIRAFCKQHAAKDLEAKVILRVVGQRDEIQSRVIAMKSVGAVMSGAKMNRLGPALLLSACLSNLIYRGIVLNPFPFLEQLDAMLLGPNRPFLNDGIMAFLGLVKHFYGPNDQAVHEIRSEIVRLLKPPTGLNSSPTIKNLQNRVHEATENTCEHFAELLLNETKELLSGGITSAMFEELVDILMTAADISTKLHVQRSNVKVYGLENLPVPFTSSSNLLIHHTLHHPELEEDEKCLENKEILMVVHPLVYAYGSSDGSDSSVKRVIKRAVVWMGSEEAEY